MLIPSSRQNIDQITHFIKGSIQDEKSLTIQTSNINKQKESHLEVESF